MPIDIRPVGTVVGGRGDAVDDHWGPVEATIELDGERLGPDATAGLAGFSHLEVVFLFDRVADDEITWGARHPRGRADWPEVGILAQRAKGRPNRIGVSVCELIGVDGLRLRVRGLDAVEGTPVLDVKPYMPAFGPRGPVRQPAWAEELMRDYW
ncbi:MAG TPA: SAM-dependent methyltransferase [Acidimicrobiales bacterium]|nr:SAM-dependent methyltransferase [Acidimicrobiales bacterium]HLN43109.1 SAM-dependent methyltransferase [Acidimicrobiales bacterium]